MTLDTFNPLGEWEFQVHDQVGSRLSIEFATNGTFKMVQRVGMFQVPVNGSWTYNSQERRLVLQGVVNTFQPFELVLTITGQSPMGFTAIGGDAVRYILTRDAAQVSPIAAGEIAQPAPVSNPPVQPVEPPKPGPEVVLPQLCAAIVSILLKSDFTDDFNGRSSLLSGIPNSSSLNRSNSNQRTDLVLVVNQLAELGRLKSGTVALVILIDNALPFLEGFAIEDDLKKIRAQVAELYNVAE